MSLQRAKHPHLYILLRGTVSSLGARGSGLGWVRGRGLCRPLEGEQGMGVEFYLSLLSAADCCCSSMGSGCCHWRADSLYTSCCNHPTTASPGATPGATFTPPPHPDMLLGTGCICYGKDFQGEGQERGRAGSVPLAPLPSRYSLSRSNVFVQLLWLGSTELFLPQQTFAG